jgi:hypothetical protein
MKISRPSRLSLKGKKAQKAEASKSSTVFTRILRGATLLDIANFTRDKEIPKSVNAHIRMSKSDCRRAERLAAQGEYKAGRNR